MGRVKAFLSSVVLTLVLTSQAQAGGTCGAEHPFFQETVRQANLHATPRHVSSHTNPHLNEPWLIVYCDFPDLPLPNNALLHEDTFSDRQGGLTDYWFHQSGGAFLFSPLQAGRVTLPHPWSAYVLPPPLNINYGNVITDCFAGIKHHHAFPLVGGVMMLFNSVMDGASYGTHRYTFQSTLHGPITTALGLINTTGATYRSILAHEQGHMLGLRHTDNSDGDASTYDNPWDVMSAVGFGRLDPFAAQGRTYPQSVAALHRLHLAWPLPSLRLEEEGISTFEIQRYDTADENALTAVHVIWPPDSGVEHVLDMKSRRDSWYDVRLPGTAVLLYSLAGLGTTQYQGNILDAEVPPATFSINDGTMFTAGERFEPSEGSFELVVKEQTADGYLLQVHLHQRIFRDTFEE